MPGHQENVQDEPRQAPEAQKIRCVMQIFQRVFSVASSVQFWDEILQERSMGSKKDFFFKITPVRKKIKFQASSQFIYFEMFLAKIIHHKFNGLQGENFREILVV